MPFYPFLHLFKKFILMFFASFPAAPSVCLIESLFLRVGSYNARSVKVSLNKQTNKHPYVLFFFKITLDKPYTKHCNKQLQFKRE